MPARRWPGPSLQVSTRSIGDVAGRTVSLYWPFRGEPDLRPWMASVIERGGATALPIVVEKAHPLIFRAYRPGDRLEKGVWNIPFRRKANRSIPDIVISPIVGIDPRNYRLGYGGGFFDRTLAAMPTKIAGHRRRLRDAAHLRRSTRSRTTSRWTG